MIIEHTDFIEQIHQRKLALIVFNKDARTLLRAVQAGLAQHDFTISHLVDFTLPWRPEVHAMARQVIDGDKLITSWEDFSRELRKGAFDFCLIFDAGYEDRIQEPLYEQQHEMVFSPEEMLDKLKADYDNYVSHEPMAQFNFRWSRYVVQFLVAIISNSETPIMQAYNEGIGWVEANDNFVFNVQEHHHTLPRMFEDLSRVPLRFVLGEDWGCGKTSYLLNRMLAGASGLAGDHWFHLISPRALPMFSMRDMFHIKGVIINAAYNLWRANPDHPVYIKLDGRLDEFLFGLPKDRSAMIGDMPAYFEDCGFVFVSKPKDNPRFDDLVRRFGEKFGIEAEKIKQVRMHYDSSEEEF